MYVGNILKISPNSANNIAGSVIFSYQRLIRCSLASWRLVPRRHYSISHIKVVPKSHGSVGPRPIHAVRSLTSFNHAPKALKELGVSDNDMANTTVNITGPGTNLFKQSIQLEDGISPFHTVEWINAALENLAISVDASSPNQFSVDDSELLKQICHIINTYQKIDVHDTAISKKDMSVGVELYLTSQQIARLISGLIQSPLPQRHSLTISSMLPSLLDMLVESHARDSMGVRDFVLSADALSKITEQYSTFSAFLPPAQLSEYAHSIEDLFSTLTMRGPCPSKISTLERDLPHYAAFSTLLLKIYGSLTPEYYGQADTFPESLVESVTLNLVHYLSQPLLSSHASSRDAPSHLVERVDASVLVDTLAPRQLLSVSELLSRILLQGSSIASHRNKDSQLSEGPDVTQKRGAYRNYLSPVLPAIFHQCLGSLAERLKFLEETYFLNIDSHDVLWAQRDHMNRCDGNLADEGISVHGITSNPTVLFTRSMLGVPAKEDHKFLIPLLELKQKCKKYSRNIPAESTSRVMQEWSLDSARNWRINEYPCDSLSNASKTFEDLAEVGHIEDMPSSNICDDANELQGNEVNSAEATQNLYSTEDLERLFSKYSSNVHNYTREYQFGHNFIPSEELTRLANIVRHFVHLPSMHPAVPYRPMFRKGSENGVNEVASNEALSQLYNTLSTVSSDILFQIGDLYVSMAIAGHTSATVESDIAKTFADIGCPHKGVFLATARRISARSIPLSELPLEASNVSVQDTNLTGLVNVARIDDLSVDTLISVLHSLSIAWEFDNEAFAAVVDALKRKYTSSLPYPSELSTVQEPFSKKSVDPDNLLRNQPTLPTNSVMSRFLSEFGKGINANRLFKRSSTSALWTRGLLNESSSSMKDPALNGVLDGDMEVSRESLKKLYTVLVSMECASSFPWLAREIPSNLAKQALAAGPLQVQQREKIKAQQAIAEEKEYRRQVRAQLRSLDRESVSQLGADHLVGRQEDISLRSGKKGNIATWRMTRHKVPSWQEGGPLPPHAYTDETLVAVLNAPPVFPVDYFSRRIKLDTTLDPAPTAQRLGGDDKEIRMLSTSLSVPMHLDLVSSVQDIQMVLHSAVTGMESNMYEASMAARYEALGQSTKLGISVMDMDTGSNPTGAHSETPDPWSELVRLTSSLLDLSVSTVFRPTNKVSSTSVQSIFQSNTRSNQHSKKETLEIQSAVRDVMQKSHPNAWPNILVRPWYATDLGVVVPLALPYHKVAFEFLHPGWATVLPSQLKQEFIQQQGERPKSAQYYQRILRSNSLPSLAPMWRAAMLAASGWNVVHVPLPSIAGLQTNPSGKNSSFLSRHNSFMWDSNELASSPDKGKLTTSLNALSIATSLASIVPFYIRKY